MIKWFAYIVLLLIFAPRISSANANATHNALFIATAVNPADMVLHASILTDTAKTKKPPADNKKIKEVAKAKRQAKPEQVDDSTEPEQPKPKRQRRPEGLERPPEIPRRNGN